MRDATDYYNLLSDTLKNGYNQIKYLYSKVENAKFEGKYINVRTGCLIQEKDSRDNNFYFNYDQDYPLCYSFSCCGLARKRVIKRMMDFYLSCLKEYDNSQDEELMREKIKAELDSAKNDYEYLNKNNKGQDDLKLFKTIPHPGEESDSEPSVNSSSFINDESLEEENEEKNSFIDDKSISEKKEEKKKCRLMKNGKKVVNEYKKELDDLLDNNNYEGENELDNKEQEEEEDENSNEEDDEENKEISDVNSDLNAKTKYSSFKKKKKLCKSNLLNKKTKRNIINDSDEEENQENENDSCNKKEEIEEEDIKNLLKKYDNSEKEQKEKKKKKNDENSVNKEYFNNLKENINLKQRTLDAFLNI